MNLRIVGLRLHALGDWLVVLGLVAGVGGLSAPLYRALRVPARAADDGPSERRRGATPTPLDAFEAATRNPYPDLEDLRKEGEARLASPDDTAAATGLPRIRELLVTGGTGRSEVFVSGRRLGETPFVGQWSCRDGDAFRIDVVPRSGPARSLSVICRGERLEAHAP